MMQIEVSNHARIRMQQRGIPEPVLDCLLAYGRASHDHRGARILFLDKTARRRLAVEKPGLKLDRNFDAYAVLAENNKEVITVGHRTKRIPR